MQEAKIVKQSESSVTLQVTISLEGETFYSVEENILDACNAVGRQATKEALKQFDTNGEAIVVNEKRLTSRTRSNKAYHTPYGKISLDRHVYQDSSGGRVFCPLENNAKMLNRATPRFSKMLSNKYARMNAQESCSDLIENHGVKVSLSYLQDISETVGAIAQSSVESWSYSIPDNVEDVTTINMSLDGAMLLTREDGYREAMVASISLYNSEGERLHSVYFGASPEYGKEQFKKRFESEAARIKAAYPDAIYLGVADGAKDNWPLLERYTDYQLIDFYHATESPRVCRRLNSFRELAHEKTTWILT